jgi:DNA topoisomerase IA
MTSEWEQQLESIYKNKKGFGGYKDFLEKIKAFTKEEVERIKKLSFQASLKPLKEKGKKAGNRPSHKFHRYHKPK